MYLFNSGTIELTQTDDLNNVIEFFKYCVNSDLYEIEESDLDCMKTSFSEQLHKYIIEFSFWEFNLEDLLTDFVEYCKSSNISISFYIKYIGDYVGGYYYESSMDEMEDLDEFDVAARAVDNDRILKECARRGLYTNS